MTSPLSIPPHPAPQHSRTRRIIGVIGLILLAALLFAGGIFAYSGVTRVAQERATQTAQNFIAALNQGDATTAYAYTSDHLRRTQNVGQFGGAMGDLSASNPKVLKSNTTFTSNGKVASYTELEDGLPVDANNRTTATWTITLVKSGLWNWQVDGVNVE